jgi:UDP-N-acetylmuramate--L-alanine ligase/UDP-N-acetylenolpyruvoylglucosamine reductase
MPESSSHPVAQARRLIAAGASVHLAGIGGIGMAGLAFHLKARGLAVSGCDAAPGPNTAWLQARSIPVCIGHDPAHAAAADWLIRTTAVPADSPEAAAAAAAGKPVLRRGEVLPALLPLPGSVVIAGTHGKTTTTTFLTRLLQAAGRNPSFFIGGHIDDQGTMAGSGSPDLFVTEGDESDGTLALYEADIAIVTNIEFDHMEHFKDVTAFEACFTAFMRQAKRVIFCADDPRAARLAAAIPGALGYGFSPDASIRATDIEEGPSRIAYTLVRDGAALGRLELPVPGRHNILNSLAAAAAGFALGVPFETLAAAFAGFSLPHRRFDRILERPDVLVVSDYAHHPSEIRTAIQSARLQGRKRILAVYQPHRYTRTKALGPDFPPAFEGVDDLTLVPIYEASEQPLEGGTIWDLYRRFRESGSAPRLARTLREAWLDLRHRLEPGDLLLVMGAGDVEKIAFWAKEELGGLPPARGARLWREPAEELLAEPLPSGSPFRLNETLANKTTYRVGGEADAWVEAASEMDLQALLARACKLGVPVTVIGGGSNFLIPDTGLRGIALRLSAAGFGTLRIEGTAVTVGPACPAARLADAVEKAGLGGLEWLEGIPGRVGGLLRMNAGAYESEIGTCVSWIKVAEADGSLRTLKRDELVFAYRRCDSLDNRIVIEAGLQLAAADKAAIRARRVEIRCKRDWMRGLHTAGSVFRNPPGDFAGRLIEDAGWKGKTLGGARVSERHANVLVAEAGCTASDLLALMELIRDSVFRKSGVALESEIRIPG